MKRAMSNQKRLEIQHNFKNLVLLYPCGNLQASACTASFLRIVVDDIMVLRLVVALAVEFAEQGKIPPQRLVNRWRTSSAFISPEE